MMKLLRRKNRTCCYLGIVILVTLLGYYYTWQRKVLYSRPSLLDGTRSPWSRAPATVSLFQPSTGRLGRSSAHQIIVTTEVTTNEIKETTIYGRTDENNSSILLMEYIIKFEQTKLSLPRGVDRLVTVTGVQNVIDRDIPLYRKAFELHNFTVKDSKATFKASLDKNWIALLCLSYSDMRDCFETLQFSDLERYQKISHIPGIRSVLGKKDNLCQITSASTGKTPAGIQLAPSCWIMPQQYEEFAGATTNLGRDNRIFFIKPISSASGWRSRIVDLEKPEDVEYIRRFQQLSGIIQHYFSNQLVISDRPFSVRMFVLVTSMSPLRAYVYNEGIVYFRTSQRKSHHRLSTKDPWCFAQLKEYLQRVRGPQAVEAVFGNMQSAILQLLLRAEQHVASYYGTIGGDPLTGNLFRCLNCYQILGVDLVINTSLHVMISEVNGQPNMQEAFQEDVPALNSIKEQILNDMIGLVFNTDPVATNVTKIFDQLHVGLANIRCNKRQKHCLTDNDLHYVLSWQRELINLGNFEQLYPSTDLFLHNNVLVASNVQDTNLRDTLLGHKATLDKKHKLFHNTLELHDLIFDFIKLSGKSGFKSVDKSYFQHVKLPLAPPKVDHPIQHQNEEYFGALIGNVLGGSKVSSSSCSNSLNQMPYLAELVVSPGRLQPTFARETTEYKLTIPHEISLVSISATPAHCSCVAKFNTNDMIGLSIEIYNHVNWTFGIGDTTVRWLLLDSSHNQPWVINQYSIIVTRQMLSLYEPAFALNVSHKVCALTQDCSLKVYSDRPCGLYELGDGTWNDFKLEQSKKPDCKDGVGTGHWMLPCTHCTKPSSCFWREAVWTPRNCKYIRMKLNQSKSCMSNKKILLIGDSTCSGIMYYLIEKINGSLQDWSDSQTSVTYKDVNSDRTTFSFTYYPQFWLSKNQRPVYEETLSGLLKQNGPLSNDSSTVLIIAGVQWMNHHHIKVTHQLLNGVGLTGITVIIKGLSSGFYQPSTGIKWISLESQRKLVKLQGSLSQLASQFGYNMIDTLEMTITRHKHFLYGNCACHFHKVVPSSIIDLEGTSDQHKESHDPRGYHVLGDINAVYSEIALIMICKSIT